MDQEAVSTLPKASAQDRKPGARPLVKRLWRKVRQPLARSRVAKTLLVNLTAGAVRLVNVTNKTVTGSDNIAAAVLEHTPAIAAIWHGQHLLAPALNPGSNRMVALFSRSADAEINARVAEKLGFGVVRGSGGRAGEHNTGKGGARALIALKKTLDAGTNVAMIADIPHGTPREAGLGIVTLAKVSGRPIVPVAVATSRRTVLEKTWDKTTINLPFGRKALAIGAPIHVAPDAGPQEMEEKRRAVTEALNEVTLRAYRLADGGER